MRKSFFIRALAVAALFSTGALHAQVPNALLYDIPGPPAGAAGDEFGTAIAVSGRWMVVGAYLDDTGATDSGRAYVYDLYSATPAVPAFTLTNPGPAASDWFGLSVGISGTLVVVGARGDNTGASKAGSAYVFDIGSGTPTAPLFTLNNPSPAVNEEFGLAVGISGTLVVVGSPQDDAGAADAGSAYVYDLNSATPTVPAFTLNNPSPAPTDRFGRAVAISGTRVVVGAYLDDTGATDTGSAYVYDVASGTPTAPVLTLNNPSPTTGDWFGRNLAISGARVVVGAYFDNTGASDAGSAYVYELGSLTPTAPAFTLNNPSPVAGDKFGNSVAISGPWVVVGANLDDAGATDAGSGFVYNLISGTPTAPVFTLNKPSPTVNDQFGLGVAIDGATILIGAPLDDSSLVDQGAVYVFGLDDTDGDGIPDIYETGTGVFVSSTNTGTSPTNTDSDGDGLADGQEVYIHHSNPNIKDTDGDGFDDGFEVATGFSPTTAGSSPDALSTILTAVEYRFNAALGVSYRIEASTDLTNWQSIETPIIGTSSGGGVVTRFYSIEGQQQRFFRSRRN